MQGGDARVSRDESVGVPIDATATATATATPPSATAHGERNIFSNAGL